MRFEIFFDVAWWNMGGESGTEQTLVQIKCQAINTRKSKKNFYDMNAFIALAVCRLC